MALDIMQATRIMEALATTNEQFAELCRSMRKRAGTVSAKHEMSVRRYGSETLIEFYVDVELRNGKNLGWWMEIHCGERRWIIESSVHLNDEHGEEKVREFPDHMTTSLEEFLSELEESTAALSESVGCYDQAFCL